VVPSWRRRGVARALVARLQEEHGPTLWLTCLDNLVSFYEQFGFEEVQKLSAMPSYFRRASRFFNLYLALTRREPRLAVMVWQPAERGQPPHWLDQKEI
jgi:GNAT superfamily N-acetyltransferase